MSPVSANPAEASILVVDRQLLLHNALCADLRTECSITVYEACTSGEATALAQAVQPDVVVLDLGVQDIANAEALYQMLEQSVHLGILVYSDPGDDQAMVNPLTEVVPGEKAPSSSVKHFILAIRRACREVVRTEPDMAHQLFRIWDHHSLEPAVTDVRKYRQLKVLVLTLRDSSSPSKGISLGMTGKAAWPFTIGRRAIPQWEKCSVACHGLKTDLLHLVHSAESWMLRSWRGAWQLRHTFIASPSVGESS